jgi:hypothetical protein
MERNINIKINDNDEVEIVDDYVEDWIYTVKVISKWYNVFVENSIIKFKDDVEGKVKTQIIEYGIKNLVIILSADELFKRNILKYRNSSGIITPLMDNDQNDKIKHLEDEIKMLKTKTLMLENKLKFYESEIGLIKTSLGL